MCNKSDNIQNAAAFYQQFTGIKLKVKRALPEQIKHLPIIITRAYSIYVTEMMRMPVLLLEVKNTENITPLQRYHFSVNKLHFGDNI